MATSLIQDLKRLRRLKVDATKKNKAAKEAAAEFKRFQQQVYDRMDAEKVGSTALNGTQFVPTETYFGNVQDFEAFEKWAQENAPHLLQTKASDKLVSEEVRRRLDDGEELPPGVSFYVDQYISQRAA